MADRLNWKPIQKLAKEAAAELGHDIEPFSSNPRTPSVRMSGCLTCYGCCWTAYSPSRGASGGFTAGGRILKYKCGTKEAMGVR